MCPTGKLHKTTADEARVEKSTGRRSPRGRSLGLQVVVRAEEAREGVLLYRMKNRLYIVLLLILWSQQDIGTAQEQSSSLESVSPSHRLNYHTAPVWTHRLMKEQHRYTIPSTLILDDGTEVGIPGDWYKKRRPELVCHWTKILGKLSPSKADEKWFGDIRNVVIHDTEEKEG